MEIHSYKLFWAKNLWKKVGTLSLPTSLSSYASFYYGLKKSSVYGGYTFNGESPDDVYFTENFNGQSSADSPSGIYANLYYLGTDGYFYAVGNEKNSSSKLEVTIHKMTSWGTYSTASVIDNTIAYNTYSSLDDGGIYKIGNYYIYPYSVKSYVGSGASAKTYYYLRYAYSTNLTSWTVKAINTTHEYIICLGSSGSKIVAITTKASDHKRYPLVINSYSSYSLSSTSVSVDPEGAWYFDGAWYAYSFSRDCICKTTNGTTYETISSSDPRYSWLKRDTLIINGQYLCQDGGALRLYSKDFSTYAGVQPPGTVVSILGMIDGEVYVYCTDNGVYKASL